MFLRNIGDMPLEIQRRLLMTDEPSDLNPSASKTAGDILVEARKVSRVFRLGADEIRAVDNVSCQARKGRLITVRGRSGSGKTTLLNQLGALDKPDEGEVYFRGRPVNELSESERTNLRRHNFGFVFQSFALLPVLSAFENIELTMRIAGRSMAERTDRTREVLDMVGLGERSDHRPFELSGGEQQRVSIARSMANRPSVLIADEPTGELDSITGLEIMSLFRRIVDTDQLTVIMSTHDPALNQFADESWLMEDGRLEQVEGELDIDIPELRQRIEFVEN